MSFAPADRADEACNQAKDNLPASTDHLIGYMERTWFDGAFDAVIWTHYDTLGPRINNHVEAYPRSLNGLLVAAHLNVYRVDDVLKLWGCNIGSKSSSWVPIRSVLVYQSFGNMTI